MDHLYVYLLWLTLLEELAKLVDWGLSLFGVP